MSENGKMYLNILKEINHIMRTDKLEPGDRLPSERELAERLQAGRSSVREALRALELLDLIETRKGEGTFIQEAGSHRLAEILASFFLKDSKARQDVTETRKIIEVEAVRLACKRADDNQLEKLNKIMVSYRKTWGEGEIPVEEDYLFHRTLVECSHNKLMLNIWHPLVAYAKIAIKESLSRTGRPENAIEEHNAVLEAVSAGNEDRAVKAITYHLDNSRF